MLDGVKKLAIHGKAKTGKNTVAELCREFMGNKRIFTTAFADPIKDMLLYYYGENLKPFLYGPSKMRNEIFSNSLTYRDMLKEHGELYKKYDPNIWIKITEQRIQDALSYNEPNYCDLIIISDLRFMREYEWVKKEGFKILKLTRPNNDYSNNDVSETQLDEMAGNLFDFHLDNDSDVNNLAQKVKDLLILL